MINTDGEFIMMLAMMAGSFAERLRGAATQAFTVLEELGRAICVYFNAPTLDANEEEAGRIQSQAILLASSAATGEDPRPSAKADKEPRKGPQAAYVTPPDTLDMSARDDEDLDDEDEEAGYDVGAFNSPNYESKLTYAVDLGAPYNAN